MSFFTGALALVAVARLATATSLDEVCFCLATLWCAGVEVAVAVACHYHIAPAAVAPMSRQLIVTPAE